MANTTIIGIGMIPSWVHETFRSYILEAHGSTGHDVEIAIKKVLKPSKSVRVVLYNLNVIGADANRLACVVAIDQYRVIPGNTRDQGIIDIRKSPLGESIHLVCRDQSQDSELSMSSWLGTNPAAYEWVLVKK